MFSNDRPAAPLIEFQHRNLRKAYRIHPRRDDALELLIGDGIARVANISSAGIAFQLDDIFHGQAAVIREGNGPVEGTLYLERDKQQGIPVTLEILHHEAGFYRCRLFAERHAHQTLCRYIVSWQKQLIREQKK